MSITEEAVLDYLRDTGALVREAALEAWAQAPAGSTDPFEVGRAIAYYEVASLLVKQAGAFGLPPSAISFEGFDPDRDLLGSTNDAQPPPAGGLSAKRTGGRLNE